MKATIDVSREPLEKVNELCLLYNLEVELD